MKSFMIYLENPLFLYGFIACLILFVVVPIFSSKGRRQMKAIKLLTGLLTISIALPINLYLQYKVLRAINATELMMFLYWINFPIIILFSFIEKVIDKLVD